MLDERKAAILTAVVEEYIDTATPVGSSAVAAFDAVNVSSATVRNDMSALEAEGYLVQPHTSAGRIPTEKAYRYFVDALGQGTLNRPDRRQVTNFFRHIQGEIEHVMRDTASLLSGLTDYAAVVVDNSTEAATVRSLQVVELAPRIVVAVTVLSNGAVEKQTIELDNDIQAGDVEDARQLVAAALMDRVPSSPAELALSGKTSVDVVAGAVMEAVVVSVEPDRVYVDGASNVAGAFDAVDSVKRVLTILEQQLVVVSVLTDVLDRGLNVAIGSETGLDRLEDCSVVVAPYEIEGEHAGSIAVLGPTRMHYPQAMAAVAAVSRQLGKRLSEG
ncbi:MAG: heat-inducible transcriptional repressor [Acidimicrobiales bacterium]|jgi:heat-inducible transcriptional repressor